MYLGVVTAAYMTFCETRSEPESPGLSPHPLCLMSACILAVGPVGWTQEIVSHSWSRTRWLLTILTVLVRHSLFSNEHDDAHHRHYSICRPSLDKCNGRAQRGPVSCTECVLPPFSPCTHSSHPPFAVGWTSTQPQNSNAGFHQSYDQSGYGYAQQDVGVKVRMINLISAVRTLMRSKRVQTCMEYIHQTLI